MTQKSPRKTTSPTRRRRRASVKQLTVCGGFKDQLNNLMKIIDGTRPWYIRCIKPNDKNVPNKLVSERLLQQLRYGGVLEAVRVSRAGYPYRIEHLDFVNKFGSMVSGVQNLKKNNSEKCQTIIDGTKLNERDCQVGLTKVFLRQDAYDRIEAWRWKRMNLAAVIVQSRARGHTQVKIYKAKLATLYRAVVMIKMWLRRRHLKFVRQKAAIRTINRFCRQDFQGFLARVQAVICIQCFFRILLAKRIQKIRIIAHYQAIEDGKLTNQIKRLQKELDEAREVIKTLEVEREKGGVTDTNSGGSSDDGGNDGENENESQKEAELFFETTVKSLVLENQTLSKTNILLETQLNTAVVTNASLQVQLEDAKTNFENQSLLMQTELDAALATNEGLQIQLNETRARVLKSNTETSSPTAPVSLLKSSPQQERRGSKTSDHPRRYSPKPKVHSSSLNNIEAVHVDLLQANEFLVVANKQLMNKMAESTIALGESTSRNDVLSQRLAALEENDSVVVSEEQTLQKNYELELEQQVAELEDLLEGRPVIGNEDAVKLATENRMLKARVEMQAQLNTALAIECEDLRSDTEMMEQVRTLMSSPSKKKGKR